MTFMGMIAPSDDLLALVAFDLLARIVVARPVGPYGFDASAVDDDGDRAGVAAVALAIRHDQSVVDLLEHLTVAKGSEPAIDSWPRWKVRRQKPPPST